MDEKKDVRLRLEATVEGIGKHVGDAEFRSLFV
jgi:hypothetical protein